MYIWMFKGNQILNNDKYKMCKHVAHSVAMILCNICEPTTGKICLHINTDMYDVNYQIIVYYIKHLVQFNLT